MPNVPPPLLSFWPPFASDPLGLAGARTVPADSIALMRIRAREQRPCIAQRDALDTMRTLLQEANSWS